MLGKKTANGFSLVDGEGEHLPSAGVPARERVEHGHL